MPGQPFKKHRIYYLLRRLQTGEENAKVRFEIFLILSLDSRRKGSLKYKSFDSFGGVNLLEVIFIFFLPPLLSFSIHRVCFLQLHENK